jgi:DNA-binding response OmpR family regulator
MSETTVLVVAKDQFIAALLGALVQLTGRKSVFPADGDDSESAIARSRPDLMLVDCALGGTVLADAAAAARTRGVPVLLFSAAHTDREAEAIASRHRADWFVLPIRPSEFRERLDSVLRPVHGG